MLAYDCREADERAAQHGKHPWFYECQDMVALCDTDAAVGPTKAPKDAPNRS